MLSYFFIFLQDSQVPKIPKILSFSCINLRDGNIMYCKKFSVELGLRPIISNISINIVLTIIIYGNSQVAKYIIFLYKLLELTNPIIYKVSIQKKIVHMIIKFWRIFKCINQLTRTNYKEFDRIIDVSNVFSVQMANATSSSCIAFRPMQLWHKAYPYFEKSLKLITNINVDNPKTSP